MDLSATAAAAFLDGWAKDAANVLLGWLLGVGSTWAAEKIRERKKGKAVKLAISLELREVALRLLSLVYTIQGRHGGLTKDLLQWMVPALERYSGPNPTDGILEGVRGLLQAEEEEFAKATAYLATTTPPQFYPREDPTYTMAAVSQLHDLDPDYTVRVLDVLAHIRMLNDSREHGLHYSRLTFTPGLTSENHAKATQNADTAEVMSAKRARLIVEKIMALETLPNRDQQSNRKKRARRGLVRGDEGRG